MSNKKIIIAGGTGLIGTKLKDLLIDSGYQVKILTRNPDAYEDSNYFKWDLDNMYIDSEVFPADIIINLAGEGIANGRWTVERKRRIINSRINSSKLLLNSASKAQGAISQYISASAIGYYGDRGDELLTEESSVGKGFLAEVVEQWENEALKWQSFAEKNLFIRIGIVLSKKGGALKKILMPMKFGVANYFGKGDQYYSWIHIDDLCKMFIYGIDQNLRGIYNGVSPHPSTNKNFLRELQVVYPSKTALIPIPDLILKVGMGEMSTILLNSSQVSPKKIIEEGFEFQFPELKEALKDLIN